MFLITRGAPLPASLLWRRAPSSILHHPLPLWRGLAAIIRALSTASSTSSSRAGVGGDEERLSARKRLKQAPIDPQLFQHLDRLGLGGEGRYGGKGRRQLQRKKKLVKLNPKELEGRLKPANIEYFQQNRFRQGKRAVRKEKRRLRREASNKIHLMKFLPPSNTTPPPSYRGRRPPSSADSSLRQNTGAGGGISNAAKGGEGRGKHMQQYRREEEEGQAAASSSSLEAIRRVSRLFRPTTSSTSSTPPRFAAVVEPHQIPPAMQGVPEIALAGRSNVGKSTLLNALLGLKERLIQGGKSGRAARGAAAATGVKPGVTQSLDFYRVGPSARPRMVVVDLPGYGFAYGKEERVEQCQRLTLEFLRYRGSSLKRLLLLLDARHGLKAQDHAFLQLLYQPQQHQQQSLSPLPSLSPSTEDDNDEEELSLPPASPPSSNLGSIYRPPKLQVVLTKCDLLPRDDLARRIGLLKKELQDALPRESKLRMLLVSAGKGKRGLTEMQLELSSLIPLLPPLPSPPSSSSSSPLSCTTPRGDQKSSRRAR